MSLFNTALPQQTRLASSTLGTLCIKRWADDLPPPTGPCPIKELPLELLTQILDHVGALDWSPQLVCKRWRVASEPILYRTIRLGNNKCKMMQYLHRLRQAFIPNPTLGRYIRELYLLLDYPNGRTCNLIGDIVDACPGIRSLTVFSLSYDIQPIFEAASRLSRLDMLQVGARDLVPGWLPLQWILPNFKRCPLKTLYLHRYGIGMENTITEMHWIYPSGPVPREMLDEVTRLVKDTTTTVETLELTDPYAPPAITEVLLTWPKALVNLNLRWFCHGMYIYTVNALQKILDIHRCSLQMIEIGKYPRSPPGIPDFSRYPKLRQLSLSMYNLLEEEPDTAAVNLTAPVLSYICGSFASEYEDPTPYSAFGRTETDWMERFVSRKIPRGTLDNLQSMEIVFDRESPSGRGNTPWPWEHMEEARELLRKAGVNLIQKPLWTKEEWSQTTAEDVQECDNPQANAIA